MLVRVWAGPAGGEPVETWLIDAPDYKSALNDARNQLPCGWKIIATAVERAPASVGAP